MSDYFLRLFIYLLPSILHHQHVSSYEYTVYIMHVGINGDESTEIRSTLSRSIYKVIDEIAFGCNNYVLIIYVRLGK